MQSFKLLINSNGGYRHIDGSNSEGTEQSLRLSKILTNRNKSCYGCGAILTKSQLERANRHT